MASKHLLLLYVVDRELKDAAKQSVMMMMVMIVMMVVVVVVVVQTSCLIVPHFLPWTPPKSQYSLLNLRYVGSASSV